MSDGRLLSPRRRDVLVAVVALVLVTGPLWVTALHFDDPTYHYTRTEVVAEDTNIEYANETRVPHHVRISEDVGCQNGLEARVCAFEELLLDNQTISSGAYTNNPNYTQTDILHERYEYALVNETTYQTIYVPNESARDDGLYRLDLDLEQVPPEEVLLRVSLPVGYDEVPSTVASAARTGDGYAHREVEAPKTPIRLEDDTYYRVYLESQSEPASPFADTLLTYVAPMVGGAIGLLYRSERVTHRGDGPERGQ